MATPWKHPSTGVYYLRRQIPEKLRPAFDGKALWKVSLGTKNGSEATVLFLQANAALEQRFEEARARLKATGSPCPSARDHADELVAAYFQGPELKAGGLDGIERLLLARLELDRGLWNATPTGCSSPTYIDIDDYAADPSDDAKSIKTATSRRLVPVHAKLIDLGFRDYVDAVKKAGHTRLFPDLVPNGFGKRTKEASRIANRLIDRYVSTDARLVFHSFRHGFKDLALEANVLERIVDQICGHAATTVGGKYGQGVRLTILNRELHKVDWSFLDWATLVQASAQIDWVKRFG
ncbi:hypothetical protein NS258_05070 [Sphingomonas sanguinis]|uniref:DUF6538 domain-containing protein n=2 Tax=Sphingomonas sanguinis TaxID=33051 RepID=A0A147JAR0_9SPHN|nr:hypothetical protein NS258_05070 [Sphingomonas sanguinis]